MFSANNEQPWRYISAEKNTESFKKILQSLMPSNAAWAKNAAAFIVSIAKIKDAFELNEYLKPVAVIALGYLDEADKLEEPFKTRERSSRKRKELSEIILNYA